MASLMKMKTAKRKAKRLKAGRRRKNRESQRSTLTMDELFAPIDKPESN